MESQRQKGRIDKTPQQHMKVIMQVQVRQSDTVESFIDLVRETVCGHVCIKDKDDKKVPLQITIEELLEHGVGKSNSVWMETDKGSRSSKWMRPKPY